MFYPDCGFGIFQMASPNSVLLNIYEHLLSSASPEICLHPAHSVTRPPARGGHLPRAHSPMPPCASYLLRSPVSAASGALPALLPVYVCAPCPFTQRQLPQAAVQIESLTSELTLPSSPEQFSVRVACPSGNSAPLSWDPHP